jgi:hypothetical protein
VVSLLLVGVGASASQPFSKDEAEAVRLARTAVADKNANRTESLEVVAVSPAQWRDTSLGCPERGMVYATVLTSGYEVTLRGAQLDHVVHVAGGRAVVCESKETPKISPIPLISASLKAAEATRAALSARLKVAPATVRIVSTRPATATARESCSAAPGAPTGAAFLVEARARGRVYRYYSDSAATLSCDPQPKVDG